MIELHSLHPSAARHSPKRVGRGNASGKGTTAGRGTKGQRSRTGGRNSLIKRSYKALLMRTPKLRGFRSRRIKTVAVTLADIQAYYHDGQTINPANLHQAGLIKHRHAQVKVIGHGPINKKITVQVHKFSAAAKAAIIKAGGQAQEYGQPPSNDSAKTTSSHVE